MAQKFEIDSRHITGKSSLSQWPVENQRVAWRIFCKVIRELRKEGHLTIRAFVLMKNHYHLIVDYDDQRDQTLLEWFHELLNLHFFHYNLSAPGIGPRPQVVILDNLAAYRNTYKYVYRNPVEAGIVFKAEDYAFSTLRYVLGHGRKPFPCEDNMNIIQDPYRVTKWVNAAWGEQLYFKLN